MTQTENPHTIIRKLQRELGLKNSMIKNCTRQTLEMKDLMDEIERLKKENEYLKKVLKISTESKSVQEEIEAAIGQVYTNFLPSMIKSHNRKSELVEMRHIWMHLMYKFSGMTFVKIANIANRDHSTIIYAIQKVDGFLLYDKQFKTKYEKVFKIVSDRVKSNETN